MKEARQRGNLAPLVATLAEAIQQSVEWIEAVLTETEMLRKHWTSTRQFRRNSAAKRALSILPEYPILTVRRLESLLGVSFKAANAGIEKLVGAGVLHERTGYAPNRVIVGRELLDLYMGTLEEVEPPQTPRQKRACR